MYERAFLCACEFLRQGINNKYRGAHLCMCARAFLCEYKILQWGQGA